MDGMMKPEPPSQVLLWIDGVGGYLVCLKPRVTLGRARPEGTPDTGVPDAAILAAISRHHATLERDAEGYFLEAIRSVALNGQPVERAFLRSGDRLTLGTACQLVFSQPVPISASARLDLVSGQRWLYPVSAVLLMAETLIFGPGPQAHVAVEELKQPLILFRPKDGLAIRYGGNLVINGRPHKDRGALVPGAHVSADGLSLALESAAR
jgi:hypothetical protein